MAMGGRGWWLLVVVLLVGCAHGEGRYSGGRYQSKELEYRVGDLPDGWRVGSRKPADVAFFLRKRGATIYVDNSCRRYTDASLTVLANHLFYGFDEVEVLEQETFELDGREALRRIVLARLDGVRVQLGVTVLKKNHCIFDLVLLAPRGEFDGVYPVYEDFVDSFEVVRCP